MQKPLFSKFKKSGQLMPTEKVIYLILAVIVAVPLLLLLNKVVGPYLFPEKVSTKEVKNIAIELTELKTEIDNANWDAAATKSATITLPIQLKKGLTIHSYTHADKLTPPTEKCKEVSCLELKKDGQTAYVYPLPKKIIFEINELFLQGEDKIINLKIKLTKVAKDDAENVYVADIKKIAEEPKQDELQDTSS